MADERKPNADEQKPPEGGAEQKPPEPNPGPSVEELRKQNEELQKQMKERDAKISDLETTKATIEARQRQLDENNRVKEADENLQKRISQINERRVYDPEGADKDLASLLSEVKTEAARNAVTEAQTIISQQSTIEKLRLGVKTSNPDFDEDVVDVIMQRANYLATTGKYKTAEEAIKAATDYIKQKFDNYAQKRNTPPPLPPGAIAEGGGANMPPKPPEPPKEKTPLDELEEANEAKRNKII